MGHQESLQPMIGMVLVLLLLVGCGTPTPALDDADAYFSRGIAYLEKDEYDLAIAEFDKAIQLDPDYAKAYAFRGIAYHDKGNLDRTIADFDKPHR